MALGEVLGDTLAAAEQDLIARRCRKRHPIARLRAPFETMTGSPGPCWTPPAITPETPAIHDLPLVADGHGDDRGRDRAPPVSVGLRTVEAAVDFVCEVVAEATQAMAEPQDAGKTMH